MAALNQAECFLGIELGSTRIKAVLIDGAFAPVASGGFSWENKLENGYWTYSLDLVRDGVRAAFAELSRDFEQKHGEKLTAVASIGISAMMHGYLAFDENDTLLVPFRTWRNTTTAAAASKLTELFGFNVPQRWSVSHLYQAILDKEPHVPAVAHITTLAGYVHYMLTGERAVGSGEASGMFPLGEDGGYDAEMLRKFSQLIKDDNLPWNITDILPAVKPAGERCGALTESGAAFLDPTGTLKAGIPFCPPEGDAGTGMVATNSVSPRTGNVSAGTSVFSMLVLDRPLGGAYPEIDVVATPDGKPVAMVHCNNCCSELDAWVRLFGEFSALLGKKTEAGELYELLYRHAMGGSADCGGVTAYNFLSGEPVAGVEVGVPMYLRAPDGEFTLSNFVRAELYAAFAALKMGSDLLRDREGITAESYAAHGGIFKVRGVAQQILSDALGAKVTVTETAGEGGAWGMALLAAYMVSGRGKTLADWLGECVFSGMSSTALTPSDEGTAGFAKYMERFTENLWRQRS